MKTTKTIFDSHPGLYIIIDSVHYDEADLLGESLRIHFRGKGRSFLFLKEPYEPDPWYSIKESEEYHQNLYDQRQSNREKMESTLKSGGVVLQIGSFYHQWSRLLLPRSESDIYNAMFESRHCFQPDMIFFAEANPNSIDRWELGSNHYMERVRYTQAMQLVYELVRERHDPWLHRYPGEWAPPKQLRYLKHQIGRLLNGYKDQPLTFQSDIQLYLYEFVQSGRIPLKPSELLHRFCLEKKKKKSSVEDAYVWLRDAGFLELSVKGRVVVAEAV